MNCRLTVVSVMKVELIDFKTRRVAAFRKNLVELAELELKHAKVQKHCRHSVKEQFNVSGKSLFSSCSHIRRLRS